MLAVSVATLVAILVVAPTVGRLIEPVPLDLWPELARPDVGGTIVAPEPTELVRFAFAAIGPMVVAALLLFGRRGPRRGTHGVSTSLAGSIGAVAALALIAAGWVARSEPSTFGLAPNYFDTRSLLVAIAFAGTLTVVVVSPRTRARARQLLGERWAADRVRLPHFVALVTVVVGATVLYATPAVYTTETLRDAEPLTRGHVPSTFADFAAFGNGATPLSDFAAQYSNLFPWALHPVLAAFDYAPASFTLVMGALTVVSLLLLWRTLVLAVDHEWVGAALYLPILALSLRPTIEVGDERTSNASLFQIMPERYLLPLVVAWMCVRHIRGRRPHTPVSVFFVAGLAALNNLEFGGPCVVAAFAALLIGGTEPPIRQLPRLAARLVVGLGAAAAFVAAITLVRSGSLPDPKLLTYFSRLFAAQGFGLQPMPVVGFHYVIYASLAAALILAAVRRAGGHPERAHSAMLAYAGILGLGAGVYYVGRSNAITLVALFPVWGLCVALLAWASVRWLLELPNPRKLMTPIGVLAGCSLIAFGLAVTDLSGVPSPVTQAQRLTDPSRPVAPSPQRAAERFVSERTEPGEAVLILRADGHLVARRAGVRNVSLIGHPLHVISGAQADTLLRDLHEAGGTAVFLGGHGWLGFVHQGLRDALAAKGWEPVSNDPAGIITEWRQRP